MAKSRMIDTKFWDDSFIVNLDPIEKLLFLWCLTNPLTNLSGCYEVSLKRIAFDTGIDKEMVEKIMLRFEKAGKVKYWNGWIAIRNFVKHQNIGSDKIKAGIARYQEQIPEQMKEFMKGVSIGYPYPIALEPEHELESETKSEHKSEPDKPASVMHRKKALVTDGKIRYLDCVYLNPGEYEKLVQQYGQEKADGMISILDFYIPNSGGRGQKYTDHYKVLQNWVHGEWDKRHGKAPPVVHRQESVTEHNNRVMENVLNAMKGGCNAGV